MSDSLLIVAGDRYSGDEQRQRGSRLAQGLLELGLREGDVVGVMMRNNVAYADVIQACRIAGIYYCPINWHFVAAEVCVLLQDSGSRTLIADHDLLDVLGDAVSSLQHRISVGGPVAGAIDYEAWMSTRSAYAGPAASPRGHMAFTSGTSGRPKGVLRIPDAPEGVAGRQVRMAELVEQALGIAKGTRVLLPAPLYHSAASVFMQQSLLLAEMVVLHIKFDAEALLADIERHRITTVYLVPIMFVRLLRLPASVREKYEVSSVRFVASTGAPCAPDVKRAMIEWWGPVIHETYASSETGLVTCIGSEEALRKPGSAGRPVLGATVKIYRADGAICAPGEIGLIYVRQPVYADFTYLHNDAQRKAVERDGLINLGDMGYLDEDGYLFVCDRKSDMVITGGVNVYPAEIEHRLLAFPGVRDCAVIGVPDDEFGERLHAVVECDADHPLDTAALKAWLREGLASFKVPKTIETATLPRDDNGKIAKRLLRDRLWAGHQRRI